MCWTAAGLTGWRDVPTSVLDAAGREEASRLMGGADADLIAGDTLLDSKTTTAGEAKVDYTALRFRPPPQGPQQPPPPREAGAKGRRVAGFQQAAEQLALSLRPPALGQV